MLVSIKKYWGHKLAEFLKRLELDYWYKLVTLISAFILGMALFMPLQIDNKAVALFALGSLLIGVGEWINHPGRTIVNPTTGVYFTDNKRFNKPAGNLLDVIGLACAILGTYRLL